MKNGDVLVEKMDALTFYTIITDAKWGYGVRVVIDTSGNLYQTTARGYIDTEKPEGILLAMPDDVVPETPIPVLEDDGA